MNFKFQLAGILMCTLLLLPGCSKQGGTENMEMASLASSVTQAQVKVSMSITDGSKNVIYSDAVGGSSLVLRSGQNYTLDLKPSSSVPGLSYSLALTRTSTVNSGTQILALKEGSNTFSVASQGDYSMKLAVSAPKMMPLTKYYSASVTCANPSFTADSLNANAISMTPSAANNLFTVSAAGIANSANGLAPYTCGFDPTGTGIIDTAFVDCNQAINGFYSNFVSARKVSVVVKDACNIVHTATRTINLPYSVPAMGAGNVFIHGIVSNAAGFAVNDKRIDGVHYLATNTSRKVVLANYSPGQFTISSAINYGMASSVSFGMDITLTGIKGSIDPASSSGSLDVSSATIRSIKYSTDQAGDQQAAASFQGSACILSNQGVKVLFTSGTPCSSGQTGSGKQATVEVWGQYSCTGLSTSGGSISIAGSFDGLTTLVDSCYGGGGGGGGVPPIQF